jgi:glucose/mannose-6-phosphate isomerase
MIQNTDLEEFDISKMYEVYDNWPKIAEKSYDTELKSIESLKINHIVFAGMGGSGALGDIFRTILDKTSIHTSIVKGYVLPKTVDKDTLVVVTSVSGNTQETLSILKHANDLKCNLIAFSSGGKIEDYCKKEKIEYRKIKQYHSPRASFVSFLYTILKILEPILPINKDEIINSIKELEKLSQKISSKNLTKSNSSLELANWITEVPVIYYPNGFQAVAIRFKNSLQENSKIHAIAEEVLETCHNGIVSWESDRKFKPILIKGKDDHPKTKERWKILGEYFNSEKIEYKEIISINGNILSKVINLIYHLDYTSIYLAVINQKDPSPVYAINFIKKKL